ncbi:MAG TPA: hypothetical protein DCZ94_13000 [Lentisphaeria bacterium]|nr:MAG: hypothetical protein A2X48_06130 [Lentisphaerae bacterium GWF2_49_21]HBC87866.1 hypothetical protein [Lentisphaeria bacterium]
MKKLMIACFSLAVLMTFLSACGSKDDVTVNTGPYEAAVREYCKSRSMDMKVASFEKVEEKDETATAICKMEAAEMAGPKVTWKFTFKKENGKWKAVSQETSK